MLLIIHPFPRWGSYHKGAEMIKALKKNYLIIILAIALLVTNGSTLNPILPITGKVNNHSSGMVLVEPFQNIFLDDFDATQKANHDSQVIQDLINSVVDGRSDVIRGMYVKGNMALEVIQQPSGQAAFVSAVDEVITEFSMARKFGVIGMLAHNFLAGRYFSDIQIGDEINIVYGDGEISTYVVTDIQSYQALQPNSPQSQFLNLVSNQKLSATELFYQVYAGNHHLTLQTCIQVGEIDTWGRLFIIAEPV